MGNQFPAMGGMPMGGMSMGGMSMNNNNNNALDLLGMPSAQPAASSNNMLDMFGAAPSASAGLSFQLINVFNKNGVSITFMPEKTSATSNSCVLRATFANASPNEVTNFEMKVAVPKFITLKLDPPSGNVLHANNGNQVTQVVTLTNSMHGQKPVMVKLKIDYNQGGQPVSDQAQPALPANL
jgi:AP-1 complex subunit gamma-1